MESTDILTDFHCSTEKHTQSNGWLLHARYVRGEHAACMALAEEMQTKSDHIHQYAFYVQVLPFIEPL